MLSHYSLSLLFSQVLYLEHQKRELTTTIKVLLKEYACDHTLSSEKEHCSCSLVS